MKHKVIRGKGRLRRLLQRRPPSERVIPHLLTLVNLTAGFLSIVLTGREQYIAAAWIIGISLVADGLDGRFARWLKAEGDFGKQLDSLADLVSFGVAPSYLLLETHLQPYGGWGLAIAILFPVAGALRLARFNLTQATGSFFGVPITVAGTFLAALYASTVNLHPEVWVLAPCVLALLMVSNVRYPDFKKLPWSRIRIMPLILPTVVSILIVRADWRAGLFLPLLLYSASGLYMAAIQSWEKTLRPRLRELAVRLKGQ